MLGNSETVLAGAESSCVKILFADDSKLQRLMLQQTLSQAGFETVAAGDGFEAIELFQKEKPDLVILDITMPGLDGVEVSQRIREQIGDQYVPIIFITSSSSDIHLQRCIAAGADDFIGKPFNPITFTAKINSLLRVKELYQRQYHQKTALVAYQQQLKREQEVAHAVYEGMIHANFFKTPNLRYLLSPMALFNGDLLLSSQTPSGDHYILLGDFTGHGLSAAIGAGPTAETFYGMARKGFGIREIITEINGKLHKILPVDMFLAACMVCLNAETKTMSISTGGLPDNYFLVRETGEIQTMESKNLPLGIVGNEHFSIDIQRFEVAADDRLIMFTDGLVEAENESGTAFGYEGVRQCLERSLEIEDCYCQVLKNGMDTHCQGLEQQDDITIVELVCNFDLMARTENGNVQRVAVRPLKWKTLMEFDACTLRELNPVPAMINNLMEIQGLQVFREPLFLIVSELFSNALDHGLLLLDSEIKKTPEGMITYFQRREQRLAELSEGSIKVTFNHSPIEDGGRLVIWVEDSGPGFYAETVFSDLENNEKSYGRGICLVKNICRSVDYLGNGNRVKVVYEWNNN